MANGFKDIKTAGERPEDSKLPQVFTVVKLPSGFYLKLVSGSTKIGPFDNAHLARMYALVNHIQMQKGGHSDRAQKAIHINYPTWLFTYKLRGEDCADIVVAEDLPAAMKLFDF